MSKKHQQNENGRFPQLAVPISLPKTDPKRFHPLRDLLLCHFKPETVSAGGIHLPGQSAKAVAVPVATIVECGPDASAFKVGDRVLFAGGNAMAIDPEYFLIEESKLLARVDEPTLLQAPAVG